MGGGGTSNRVQVIDRACDLLECIAENGSEVGISDITRQLGLSKSTVHRILSTLQQRDYVRRVAPSGRYGLGSKLVELGHKAGEADSLATRARAYLTRLVGETGETAHLGVLRDGAVLSLSAVESPKTLRTPATVGRRTPVHCSSQGKCLVAELSADEILHAIGHAGFTQFTANTIVNLSDFTKELAKVRQRGYAVDDEEFELGLKCLGAPVRDSSGRVVAALSIAGPANRLGREAVSQLSGAVKRTAAELSSDLGYRPGHHRQPSGTEQRG